MNINMQKIIPQIQVLSYSEERVVQIPNLLIMLQISSSFQLKKKQVTKYNW